MENIFEYKMILEELKELLILSWDYETCSSGLKEKCNKDNPLLGQYAIISLIVNDFLEERL